MTEDVTRYTFKIEGFTPETMSFGRLVEYYAELTKMIGGADNLHLTGVVQGSLQSAFTVDPNYNAVLVERIVALNKGTAPRNAARARDTIDGMLNDDGTSGEFSDPSGQNVIPFAGKRADQNALLNIRDAATFTGELYHISGTKDAAKVRIDTDAYGTVFCTTTRELAKALRDFLFDDVKVSGRGRWTRKADGAWDIDDFTVTDFTPVRSETLRETVTRLRGLNVRWPDDPLGKLDDLEEKNERIQ